MKKLVTIGLLIALSLYVIANQLPSIKTWMYWTLPMSGKIIVIDPGHGGADGGAVSRDGLQEKEVTLQIAKHLRDYLQQSGALVYLTRESDHDLAKPDTRGLSRRKTEDLMARVAFMKEKRADLFISIHLNSIPSPRWFGPQTFYTNNHPDNQTMAWFIQDELRTQVVDTHRESKTIHGIYIMEQAKIPAVLVEVGFLSNEQEAANLARADYQRQLATAIYRGIMRYLSNEKFPSSAEDSSASM